MRKCDKILGEKLGFYPGHNNDSAVSHREWHSVYDLHRRIIFTLDSRQRVNVEFENFKVAVEQLREIFRLCRIYKVKFNPTPWGNNFYWADNEIRLGYTHFRRGALQLKKDFIMFDRLVKHYDIRLAKTQS